MQRIKYSIILNKLVSNTGVNKNAFKRHHEFASLQLFVSLGGLAKQYVMYFFFLSETYRDLGKKKPFILILHLKLQQNILYVLCLYSLNYGNTQNFSGCFVTSSISRLLTANNTLLSGFDKLKLANTCFPIFLLSLAASEPLLSSDD